MATLLDLLSENPENQKLLSSLKKISKRKIPAQILNSGQSAQPSSGDSRADWEDVVGDFTAIDVETTGLDPKTDRIIEVGAVRFSKGKACGEFSSFVNPGMPIPAHITALTGIRDDEVRAAPPFSEIMEAFLDFIGATPLCGHQIDFDLNFLNNELKRTGREKLASSQLDTALLSRIITPNIGRFSLKQVAKSLHVELENAHRALADARASGEAACALLVKTDSVSPPILAAMARFAPPSLLKTILFNAVRSKNHAVGFPASQGQAAAKKLMPESTRQAVALETIREFFANDGILSRVMPGFVERPAQTHLAKCVTESLNTASILVAEAGTGIGKSLAYLVPSVFYSLRNNCRILISTHTRNLQDQLISKDLPILKETVSSLLKYSVLKGRSNYLCIRQFHRLLAGELTDLSYRERMGVLPLIRWAMETKTGDIEEQNQFNIKWFSRIWRLLCADAHVCEGKRCPEFGNCFLQSARQNALSSHIVVINHALFFSELCSRSSFLGPMGAIVFDEAHHLESCGHRYLRVEVDTNRLTQFVDALAQLDKEAKRRQLPQSPEIGEGEVKALVKRIRSGISGFLDDCNAWVESRHPAADEYQIGYSASDFSQLASYAGLTNGLVETQHVMHQLQQIVESTSETERINRSLRQLVGQLADNTSQLKADLDYVCGACAEDHVFWIEGNRKKGWVKLCGVALDIASILSPLWQANGDACIFTSATLAVSHSLDYFKQKVGLSGANEGKTRGEIFLSPFKPQQAFRAAMIGGPEPDASDYSEYAASVLLSIASVFRKNILVLFTSVAMLETVYSRCKQLPFPGETTILAQGVSGGRQAILDEFKQLTCGILLGADSFWEGIDVPGKSCELVVIPRLPFQVPTHPLTKALADRVERREGQSFFSFAVPEAIIKFRQGIGRLIRSQSDKGALIVLDKRIMTKNYGKRFCNSMDGEVRSFSNVNEMIAEMDLFFKNQAIPEEPRITYVPIEEI